MLKRICACYNSRMYGSRWVLVCPAVFKTVAGGEELPRWVRFPHTLANGNRSGSAALVFVHFNPSVKPSVCQLPGRGAFWCAIQAQTITPRSGISHCESNISLRIRAISPCVSRISSRVSALPPTSSCYSRGSGCGTRAAVQWAVWAFVRLRAAHCAHMGGVRTAPHLRPAG